MLSISQCKKEHVFVHWNQKLISIHNHGCCVSSTQNAAVRGSCLCLRWSSGLSVHSISITAQRGRGAHTGAERQRWRAKMAMRRGLSEKTSLKRRMSTKRMASTCSDERADRNGENMVRFHYKFNLETCLSEWYRRTNMVEKERVRRGVVKWPWWGHCQVLKKGIPSI